MKAPTTSATVSAARTTELRHVWPHSAQLAAAFLAGIATALLMYYVYDFRCGGKPADLERGVVTNYRIDLNQAKRPELMQLPGVGESMARRVEEYRIAKGDFYAIEELSNVPGIGPTTLERLRPWVRVGSQHDVAPPDDPEKPPVAAAPAMPGAKKVAKLQGRVDVNRATLDELQQLPGIGPKMSQRIVDERRKAPFRAVEDLRRVSGIGPKVLERLRPYVVVTPAPSKVAARPGF